MTVSEPTLLCSVVSQQVGEPLYATATRVDVWFVLEYDRAFGAEAFAEADIPQHIKNYLSAAQKAVPHSRIQLIRTGKERTKADSRLNFFVAVGTPAKPALYHFRLDSYDDLLALDLPVIAARGLAYEENRSDEPLFLVCINGKRDRCCSKFGVPMYEAMSTHLATIGLQHTIWTTAHIGGHRFAATAVFLPTGVCYGRMNPALAADYIEDLLRGHVSLESYRGRCGYDEAVQAGEYFLRRQLEITLLSDFRLFRVELTDPNSWYVQFEVQGNIHGIRITAEQSQFLTYKNSTDAMGSHVTVYRRSED